MEPDFGPEKGPSVGHAVSVEPLVPPEGGLVIRPLDGGRFELVIPLVELPDLNTLRRLAEPETFPRLIAHLSASESPEIYNYREITPAMLAAGSAALEPFYMGESVYDLRATALTAIFTAMMKLSRSPCHRTE